MATYGKDAAIDRMMQNTDVLRSRLREFSKRPYGLVKVANIGGDGQDSSFEQAFSNLAHAYLRDKAPTLLDYEVGFQLLERNEENTKAVGVMGFKIGSQWLFAPVFFLKGDLKGHELLWMKQQDQFVPLAENWVNYILNRKPNVLGGGTPKNSRELGVQPPDLQSMQQSPGMKFASAYPDWLGHAMPGLMRAAVCQTEDLDTDLLTGHVKRASVSSLRWIKKAADTFPQVRAWITQFHGEDLVRQIDGVEKRANSVLAAAPAPVRTPDGSILKKMAAADNPVVKGELKVIAFDYTSVKMPEGLDEDDQEKLVRDGVLVKDMRKGEETTRAYKLDTKQKLFNPNESGLYYVLCKNGEMEKCYVSTGPKGPIGGEPHAVVFRAERSKSENDWVCCSITDIWACSRIDGEEYDKWYDSLSDADSISDDGGLKILITPKGVTTLPFRCKTSTGGYEGVKTFNVSFETYGPTRSTRSSHSAKTAPSFFDRAARAGYDKHEQGERIHITNRQGSTIQSSLGDVYVPKDAKVFNIRPESKFEKDVDKMDKDQADDSSPLMPGRPVDLELNLLSKTASLTVYSDGMETEVNRRRMPVKAAFVHLIRDHGLGEKQARDILREAERDRKMSCVLAYPDWVKQANPMLQDTMSAPAIPEQVTEMGGPMGNVPTQFPMGQHLPVEGTMTADGTEDILEDPGSDAVSTIQQAAQSGQKEVFDSMVVGLSSLNNRTQGDAIAEDGLGEMMACLNKLGSKLYSFYWHQDKFADKYGKEDMADLEDQLRNNFENLGKLVIFLKRKTVEPSQGLDEFQTDLGISASS